MKNLLHLFLLVILLGSSCHEDEMKIVRNDEGIVTEHPYHKLALLTDSEDELAILGIANSAKYDRGAVFSGINNGNRTLKMIDIDTGEELWEWYDPIKYIKYDFTQNYTYDLYLAWHLNREIFCVDMSSGNTIWKYRYDKDNSPYLRELNGIGNNFFVLASYPESPTTENPANIRLYRINSENGSKLKEVARFSLGDYSNIDNISAYAGEHLVINAENNDTLVFSDINYSLEANWEGQSYLALYNVTQNSWVYDKIELEGIDSHSVDRPKHHNGIVYLAMSPFIVAVELMTGKEVWRWHRSQAGFATSGFILVPEKNLIIFNAETSSTTLYALDLATGTQVWSEPSSGTSSRLQYLNGVVYWVGGGDGLLHAVDVDTGETLWKIRSPDEAQNSRAFFTRYCAAFPGVNGEKGKIVVSSGLHAFAYEEAER